MEVKIKDIEQVETLAGDMKVPVGNTGDDDKSYTATIDQIKEYSKQDLSRYVTEDQLAEKRFTTLEEVQNQGYVTDGAIGNGTLTITTNGTTKTFKANQFSDTSVEIKTIQKVSELTNDSGFITSSEVEKKFIQKGSGTDTNIVVASNGSMSNYGQNGQAYMAVRQNGGKFTIGTEYGGSAFGVKEDGTTAFTHKTFSTFDKDKGTGTGTKNTAVLQFSGDVGLRYAKNSGSSADVTADMYKYVGIIGSPDEKQNVYSAKEMDDKLSGIPTNTETLVFTTKDGQVIEYNFYIKN